MKTVAEFLISDVFQQQEKLVAQGICNRGEINLELVFSEAETENGDDTQEIGLSVVKIVAYRRCLDELPEGMSGELYFDECPPKNIKLGHGVMLKSYLNT